MTFGRSPLGSPPASSAVVNAAGAVMEVDFDANTVLAADTDDTPAALTVAASRILGRAAAGGIDALTSAEMKTLLGYLTDLASPPDMGETAPGSVRGTNTEIYKTATADSPLTAPECSGTIVSNYGMTDADCIIDLPTAAEAVITRRYSPLLWKYRVRI